MGDLQKEKGDSSLSEQYYRLALDIRTELEHGQQKAMILSKLAALKNMGNEGKSE
jgi:hypothetical protein